MMPSTIMTSELTIGTNRRPPKKASTEELRAVERCIRALTMPTTMPASTP